MQFALTTQWVAYSILKWHTQWKMVFLPLQQETGRVEPLPPPLKKPPVPGWHSEPTVSAHKKTKQHCQYSMYVNANSLHPDFDQCIVGILGARCFAQGHIYTQLDWNTFHLGWRQTPCSLSSAGSWLCCVMLHASSLYDVLQKSQRAEVKTVVDKLSHMNTAIKQCKQYSDLDWCVISRYPHHIYAHERVPFITETL